MGITCERCVEAWTNSIEQLGISADLVFFGDSLVYYGNFASYFTNKVVCNLGLRGDYLDNMINRVRQLSVVKPSFVFVLAGINDVASCSSETFREKYSRLIKGIIKTVPNAKIVVMSMLPVNEVDFCEISCTNQQIQMLNEEICAIAANEGIGYLDLFSKFQDGGGLPSSLSIDGIHLIPDAYPLMYTAIDSLIMGKP